MKIETTKNESALVLKVIGRIDTMTAPDLEKEVTQIGTDVTELTFDFNELDYISSAGLRVLLIAIKKMNAQGSLSIIGANDLVKEVFEVTGFMDLVKVN